MFTSGLITGLFLGAFLGIIIAGLLVAAKEGDCIVLTREEYLELRKNK